MSRSLWLGLGMALALGPAVPASRAALLASDNADNDPYAVGFNPGDNGGMGFTGWVQLDTGGFGTMYREELSPLDGLRSWGLSGTYALGRGLEEGVDEGTWSFVATHGAEAGSFCGFSLRTSTAAGSFSEGEILRFGMDYGQEGDGTRIYYSTDVGGLYGYIDLGDADLRGCVLQYTVTWSTVSGSFALGVRNLDDDSFGEGIGMLATGEAVAMFGAGIFGAGTDERMTFDAFDVASIPEPAVSASILLGALALWKIRRKA